MRSKPKPYPLQKTIATIALASITTWAGFVSAAEVSLYTTREPGLIQSLLDQFTKDTDIKVNTVFVKDGLIERVKAEGDKSPADVLMTVDIGNLIDLVTAEVTQPIESTTLNEVIPANLRGENGDWYTLSMRDRVAYVASDIELNAITYEDFADEKWKNKVCIRSGQHPYNTALIASMIVHNGVEFTENWLKDLKNNLGRKAAGGDRDVARDILGGICDIGIANAYYVGRMKNSEPGTDARSWGDAIKVIRPTFANGNGTHVNISGAAVAKHAPNKDNAIKLLEYLVSEKAQSMYANANYEYPVREGVELDPVVASFGKLVIDSIPLTEIAKNRKLASELVDKVGFNN